ncbi:MAG: LacI family DNA-binding transcriptional regulator [Lachnospiraceae bacterium]|nr:LacI family DNA-binding transcriptional regulator [Lachnospiraceae bacterium]
MNSKRVTMQDIADACGLSRNTVSKVFNGRGAVPAATKTLILKKAEELGYRLPVATEAAGPDPSGKTIALLTANMPVDYHFGTFFVTTFTDQICRAGYTMRMFEISKDELDAKELPPHFIPEQTAGIVGIEMFDPEYLDFICDLGLPTIMIDSPTASTRKLMRCDFISMENVSSIIEVVKRLKDKGAKKIGFFGDKEHCGSFHDRFSGLCIASETLGLEDPYKYSILAPDSSPYGDTDWIAGQLDRLAVLPDAFVCANDYLAIHMIYALKQKGLSIPNDIMVTGFDGITQSALADPPLTTVTIPGVEIGRRAADILLNRIKTPDIPYTKTLVATTPVWRKSSLD